MGDVRYVPFYDRVRRAADQQEEIRGLGNAAVVSALAGAVDHGDRYLTNVLATEAMNRLERAGAILSHLEAGVCAVDAAGRITFLNPAAEALLGWRLEDVAGEEAHGVLGCVGSDGACPILLALARTGPEEAVDGRATLATGEEVPMDLIASPFVQEGETRGCALLLKDARPRHAEAAQRAARAAAREAVSILLREGGFGEEGVGRILDAVGTTLGFDVVCYWTAAEADGALRCRTTWRGAGGAPTPLEALSLAHTFPRGEGAVGEAAFKLRTFARGFAGDGADPREGTARRMGLVDRIAVPVTTGTEARGVLELWSRTPRGDDEALLMTLQGIAGEIAAWSERTALEVALRQSEQRLLEASRIAHLGHWSWRPGSEMVEWSQEFCRIFGRNPTAGLTTFADYLDGCDPRDRDRVLVAISETLATGVPLDVDHRIRRPSGEVRWVHCKGQMVEEAGAPLLLGIAQDVTVLKAAQRRGLEGEARFRALADASLDGVAVHENGRILLANTAFARIFGYRPDEVVGIHGTELGPPASAAVVRSAIETGAEGPYEVLGRRKDGSLFPMEVRPRTVALGERSLRVIVVRDLTHAKAAERTIREAVGYLQTALDAIPAHVAIVRSDGTIHTVNAAWREFAIANGLDAPDGGLGLNYLAVCDKAAEEGVEAAGEMAARIRATLTGEGSFEPLEYPCHAPSEERWFLAAVSPFTAPSGTRHAITAHLNVTSAKLLERRTRELLERNRDLESFAYTVSHDLKAPLRGITALVAAAIEDAGEVLPQDARGHLEQVLTAADRMKRLVEDILAFSRAGAAGFHPERVNLAELAREVASGLIRSDPAREVTFAIPEEIEAVGDPDLLRIVLENLLGNAWKFTRGVAQPRIELGLIPRHGRAPIFYVRDNGAGFDMAGAERLFRPFERLHTVQQFEGTGVGLATVRRIIERHGGDVWAEGRPGAGATLYFTLPGPDPSVPPQESSNGRPLPPP